MYGEKGSNAKYKDSTLTPGGYRRRKANSYQLKRTNTVIM